ncbi:hypothetical protein [Rhodococcus sovatensis]|uniref:Uncharacterized protein n=1 Tax=Rhodococcus sovatensis TaxID=1805840 RepID=A0ABZ2PDD7_9NOCA
MVSLQALPSTDAIAVTRAQSRTPQTIRSAVSGSLFRVNPTSTSGRATRWETPSAAATSQTTDRITVNGSPSLVSASANRISAISHTVSTICARERFSLDRQRAANTDNPATQASLAAASTDGFIAVLWLVEIPAVFPVSNIRSRISDPTDTNWAAKIPH